MMRVPQLVVRNLELEVVRRLKARARRHGRPAEAEHREILREVLLGQRREGFKAALRGIPDVGEDSDFVRPRRKARRVRL